MARCGKAHRNCRAHEWTASWFQALALLALESADRTCSEGPREPGLTRSPALVACARTGVLTRGHCSLGAAVPARPGQSQWRGGRGTGSVARRGPRGAAPCPFLDHASRSPRETDRAKRARARGREAERSRAARFPCGPSCTSPFDHLCSALHPQPRPRPRRGAPFPATGSRLGSRAFCRHPGPAQLHLGRSRPGRHPSHRRENFPGSRRGLARPGAHPARPPAAFPAGAPAPPPTSLPTARFSEFPGEAALRRPGRGLSEGKLQVGHAQTRDELWDPQTGAAPRNELTSTRRSRAAGGAAAPPPSEEPEPQDARGLAAALRAQFRRRFPGRSRALTLSRASPPSLPSVRAAPDSAGNGCSRPRRGADSAFMPRV
ncbi:mucin-1-like [Muntiacus reevesi]|uniref:mucin-1-like n=1 Tax=Muntiacus reevesi TaxID=9886 RepID=UPI003306D375